MGARASAKPVDGLTNPGAVQNGGATESCDFYKQQKFLSNDRSTEMFKACKKRVMQSLGDGGSVVLWLPKDRIGVYMLYDWCPLFNPIIFVFIFYLLQFKLNFNKNLQTESDETNMFIWYYCVVPFGGNVPVIIH